MELKGIRSSAVISAGCRLIECSRLETLIFPSSSGENIRLQARSLEFSIPENFERFYDLVASRLDEMVLETLRSLPYINHLKLLPGRESCRRMIAAVEEANATFEAFVIGIIPSTGVHSSVIASMYGYPVYQSQFVKEGEMFGGMWSGGILAVHPFMEVKDFMEGNGKGVVHADFVPRHQAAFVRLVVE